ncbi:YccS family putative transporter [Mangrovibacterium lignilyticum]|uniref:YccS family putative transporter n=1 Tax=Mangrovibacterium lignilyticum TaxID=2668052 RepID=UPI001EE61CE4|nr:YccS family putative transporter [Mangrovibacterium lignilyticum]
MKLTKQISSWFEKQTWYEPWRRAFWSRPDRMMATKATLAIALVSIPFVAIGKPFFGITLGLGALAGALSETDDHPKGRIKSLLLKVVSFGISSFAVGILRPYPILLGLGLGISTIGFLLIGGLGERYRGVTFGAILVGIYAMLGIEISPDWYWPAVLMPTGALFYGILSLLLLYYRPYRLLEEQLARGFSALSDYFDEKANLFPSDEKVQSEVRNKLALLNVKLVGSLDSCREVMRSYADALEDDKPLKPYLQNFMLLQSLHERATSSHERYDLLSQDPHNQEMMEGIGQILHQMAGAIKQFSYSLLTGVPYRHPIALNWSVKALHDKQTLYKQDENHPLSFLILNLTRTNLSMQRLTDENQRPITPKLAKDTRTLYQRLKDQLSFHHPRMRHAIRLSICFMIGFAISEIFNMTKGEWIILTSLFVCQPSYSETRRRLFQRILGTITGVIVGVLIIQILPTVTGQLLFMLASAFFFFIWLRRKYSTAVVFITTFVLCVFNLASHQGVAAMLPRLIDTIIGSTLAIITVRLLWPDWQHKRLPDLLNTAFHKNAAYFDAIINEYQQNSTGDDFDYRVARRQAHRADNALVLAWQDMQLEPRKHQLLREQSFTLTYLNHALLSYLSALGAHRETSDKETTILIKPAKLILSILQEAKVPMPEILIDRKEELLELINDLREKQIPGDHNLPIQQIRVLTNIAELTLKLVERAQPFNAEQPA